MTYAPSLSGETILRHLRCCIVNDQPPGWCLGCPAPSSVSYPAALAALRALPRPLRAAALCYSRVGPDAKTPRTSWRTLARKQRSTHGSLLVLRQRAKQAAGLIEVLVCR